MFTRLSRNMQSRYAARWQEARVASRLKLYAHDDYMFIDGHRHVDYVSCNARHLPPMRHRATATCPLMPHFLREMALIGHAFPRQFHAPYLMAISLLFHQVFMSMIGNNRPSRL